MQHFPGILEPDPRQGNDLLQAVAEGGAVDMQEAGGVQLIVLALEKGRERIQIQSLALPVMAVKERDSRVEDFLQLRVLPAVSQEVWEAYL